jgi:hypothetical protein
MLSGIVRQSTQKSHLVYATLFARSDWSKSYACGATFDALDAIYVPSLGLTTNPVVEVTRDMLRKMRGEGQPTTNNWFHVPLIRERGNKAK